MYEPTTVLDKIEDGDSPIYVGISYLKIVADQMNNVRQAEREALKSKVDYIFSSHCLEHVETPWYDVLKYWTSKIKVGGTLFLYLPDYSQEYWRPWNNEKHKHIFTPEIMKDAFESLGFVEVFVSGVDLLNSFAIVGEKSAIR
jgi:predicted SAM-dependent methyltransferase